MKMTKIESARIIVKGNGDCKYLDGCRGCSCEKLCGHRQVAFKDSERLKYATAYIKRHESKSKKPAVKTDVRDMKNVVKDETVKPVYNDPNYHHTVDPNEKKVESVTTTTPSDGMTINPDPTPLEIAKAIRDNNYYCGDLKWLHCEKCCFYIKGKDDCLCDNGKNKKYIDTYISDHEKVEPQTVKAFEGCHALNGNECMNYMPCGLEACPAYKEKVDPVMPTPFTIEELRACMKIDMWVYYFNDKVARINLKNIHTISASRSEISLISTAEISNATDYYKTLADAVRVAEEKWKVGK
jgi:hypothetical protein